MENKIQNCFHPVTCFHPDILTSSPDLTKLGPSNPRHNSNVCSFFTPHLPQQLHSIDVEIKRYSKTNKRAQILIHFPQGLHALPPL
jgi:hypothetical protein